MEIEKNLNTEKRFRATNPGSKPVCPLKQGEVDLFNLNLSASFLKGCLESPQGMKQLKRASSGSSVISLPRAALDSEVLIPLVRRENQQKYVRSHRELEESILEHMKAIEQDRKKLADLIYVAIYDDLYPCD